MVETNRPYSLIAALENMSQIKVSRFNKKIIMGIVFFLSIVLYIRSLRTVDDVVQVGRNTFVLLKTGAEVMDEKVPLHLYKTFKWFPHHEIYADVDTPVLGQPVVNIFSYLPTNVFNDRILGTVLVRYRAMDEQWGWGSNKIVVNGRKIGWFLDALRTCLHLPMLG